MKSDLYAEFTGGSSNKFYAVGWATDSAQWWLHYGRIGTAGTINNKTERSPSAAEVAARKQFGTKIRKGYVQKNRSTGVTLTPSPNAVRPKTTQPKANQPKQEVVGPFGADGRDLF